ncbi:MAG: hypothetical protein KQ78_00399 [Candidatus Izimaplasma bacterium HR2]|nr:MAG: hypothetical protein KQ78_00399 [Candidatus Izimaplasma bacterium HR2]
MMNIYIYYLIAILFILCLSFIKGIRYNIMKLLGVYSFCYLEGQKERNFQNLFTKFLGYSFFICWVVITVTITLKFLVELDIFYLIVGIFSSIIFGVSTKTMFWIIHKFGY